MVVKCLMGTGFGMRATLYINPIIVHCWMMGFIILKMVVLIVSTSSGVDSLSMATYKTRFAHMHLPYIHGD